MIIDRNSPLPLYYQLKEILQNKIQDGEWKPGEQIPTEEIIQKEYGLSRTTVRQALQEMERAGQVTRQAGRGTFVSQAKVQEGTESFNLTASEILDQGIELTWKVLSMEWVAAPEDVAQYLHCSFRENIFCLRRFRLANDLPIGYTVSYVSPEFSNGLDLSLAAEGGSMNYIKGINLDLCSAERIVEAVPAGPETAKFLNIDRGLPVLSLIRLLCSPGGRPVEFFHGIYRGDRFRYHIQSMPPQV